MDDVAIKFENISKQYRLGLVSTKTLSHDLNRWWQTSVLQKEDPYLKIGKSNDRTKKGDSEYVWALQDISFEVKKGEVLGIIGKNGAGKSTLLKILSRVTAPTTGTIKAKGRIASLLEVGTGFHPELTGRENIYMNGSIMGMTRIEITRKLDEIVDFAGIERYIDTPTKRYSSGMTVRLGFSIAAHLEPEILVVDEVLAVGDAEFQKKAIGKMQDVSRGEGRTVLFVSHNMGAVRNLCDNGIVLENGKVIYASQNIEDAISKYIDFKETLSDVNLEYRKDRKGDGRLKIQKITVNDTNTVALGTLIKLSINYQSVEDDFFGKFYISINDQNGVTILFMDSSIIEDFPVKLKNNGNIIISISPDFALPEGKYFVSIAAFIDHTMSDYVQNALTFDVISGVFYAFGKKPGGRSSCYVKQNWEIIYE